MSVSFGVISSQDSFPFLLFLTVFSSLSTEDNMEDDAFFVLVQRAIMMSFILGKVTTK